MFGKFYFYLAIITAAILSACAPTGAAPQTPTEVVSAQDEIGGYAEFVDSLRAAGASVEPEGNLDQPFFQVDGRLLQINGTDVQVFEFADQAARQQAQQLISEDGTSVGPTMLTWVGQPNFWARGRLIVLYVGQDQAIIDLLNQVLGDPLTKPTNAAAGETPLPVGDFPAAVLATIDHLADTQNVSRENIAVIEYEEQNWPTSCLGLGEPGEMCLQAITPGWRIELRANGQTYIYHTNKSGNSIRRAVTPIQVETPLTDLQPGSEPPQAVQSAIQRLSQELDIDPGQIEVVSALQTTWSDSCLGLGGPDELCLQVMTPGWQVILSAQGKQYALHTDEDGSSVRLQRFPLEQLPTSKPNK
ncbi:MAG TPA: hypothetical protein VFZ76_05785 [Anaerolineales bacterium]